MSGKEEEFSKVCDTLIAANPTNKEVEEVIIELEVAHKKTINAIKRQFNKELDEMQADLDKKKKEYDKFREEDRDYFRKEIDKLNQDYQKQMENAQAKHQDDIRRVKSNYESILESTNQAGGVVTRIQDEHNSEIARLKEEYERQLTVKSNEIAALKRRMEEDARIAEDMAQEVETRRRFSEDDASAARRELLNVQSELTQLQSEHREISLLYDAQVVKVIQQYKHLKEGFLDRADELQLQVSRMLQAARESVGEELKDKITKNDSYTPTREECLKLLNAIQQQRRGQEEQMDQFEKRWKVIRAQQEQQLDKYITDCNTELEGIRKKQSETAEKQEERKKASRNRSGSHRDPNELSGSSYGRRGSRFGDYRAFSSQRSSRRGSMMQGQSPEPTPEGS